MPLKIIVSPVFDMFLQYLCTFIRLALHRNATGPRSVQDKANNNTKLINSLASGSQSIFQHTLAAV